MTMRSKTPWAMLLLVLALLVQALPDTADAIPPIPDGNTDALIAAIANAAPGDTIELAKNGTYVLTGEQIEIDTDIIIDGQGSALDGNNGSRVFFVNGAVVTFNDLTITGGNIASSGGGISIDNGGDVTFNNSNIHDNYSGDIGGGVLIMDGKLILNNSSIHDNANGGILLANFLAYSNAIVL